MINSLKKTHLMKHSMSWITIHCVVLLMRGDIKHEIFNEMNQHDLKHLRNTTNRLLTASVWCPGISINLCEHNDTFITLTCYSVRQKSHYEDVQHFQPRPGGRSVWGEESPQPSKAVGNEKHFCVVWIRSKTIRVTGNIFKIVSSCNSFFTGTSVELT